MRITVIGPFKVNLWSVRLYLCGVMVHCGAYTVAVRLWSAR
jgi:hypothetical protein